MRFEKGCMWKKKWNGRNQCKLEGGDMTCGEHGQSFQVQHSWKQQLNMDKVVKLPQGTRDTLNLKNEVRGDPWNRRRTRNVDQVAGRKWRSPVGSGRFFWKKQVDKIKKCPKQSTCQKKNSRPLNRLFPWKCRLPSWKETSGYRFRSRTMQRQANFKERGTKWVCNRNGPRHNRFEPIFQIQIPAGRLFFNGTWTSSSLALGKFVSWSGLHAT